jgi:hypothetical protein
MISEPLGDVCAVESMRQKWKQFSLMISKPAWLFALSNPSVTRGSSFIDDFSDPRGCLRCRIRASTVQAVLLMISETAAA